MRLLSPRPDGVDVAAVYAADERRAPPDRPWLMLNMVASADGATALGGVTRQLSSAGDRRVFHVLRSLADVIMAGAGTVRAENYGPARVTPELEQARVARGQAPRPRIAVVSGRLDLDPEARLFAGEGPRPVVVTVAGAPAVAKARLAEVADVVLAGETTVDPLVALRELGGLGARIVLCEGGPMLNGQLVAAGLVDEVCLTVAPCLVGGTSARIAYGAELPEALNLELDRALEEDGNLLLRYTRRA